MHRVSESYLTVILLNDQHVSWLEVDPMNKSEAQWSFYGHVAPARPDMFFLFIL